VQYSFPDQTLKTMLPVMAKPREPTAKISGLGVLVPLHFPASVLDVYLPLPFVGGFVGSMVSSSEVNVLTGRFSGDRRDA